MGESIMSGNGLSLQTSGPAGGSVNARPQGASSATGTSAQDATDFLSMLEQFGAAAGGGSENLASDHALADALQEELEPDAAGLLPDTPWLPAQTVGGVAASVHARVGGDGYNGIGAELELDLEARAVLAQIDPALLDAAAGDEGLVKFEALPWPMNGADALHPVRTGAPGEALLSRPVQPPVGSAAWADEIASRLTVMAEQGRHTLSLCMSPEHLGPLEVRVAVRDDQASVWFGAAHADTRAAIEHALPRLREMFAAQGLMLTDAGVHHDSPQDRPSPAIHDSSRSGFADEDDGPLAPRSSVMMPLGLIDTYA